jgi:hypothetical protein
MRRREFITPRPRGYPTAATWRHATGELDAICVESLHDQIGVGGSAAPALPAANRLLYVRDGRVVVNGQTMNCNQATYLDGPVTFQSSADWSQLWRWELASPDTPPPLASPKAWSLVAT